MTKDEMKNKISMALKDPILQQGFEIICKENADLQNENAKVKEQNGKLLESCAGATMMYSQLTKAKEIIKNLLDDFTTIEGDDVMELKSVKEAEQFIKGN